MIKLYELQSNTPIGTISESQLQFLQDQLVEEDSEDQDYYINRATLELFTQRGADPELVTLLEGAMGQRDSIDIRWEQA